MKQPIVIVGGVAAGPKMAAKARREDPDVPIILITDEEVISYAACGTPYFLGGVAPKRESMLVRTVDDFGTKNNVQMLVGHRATKIDTAAHTVDVIELATGKTQTIKYGKLGLATGASPIVPPMDGCDAAGVFTLRSVTDAYAIDDYIREHNVRHAVVAGAGFIGVEVVENLRERGIGVTLVELAPQILPPVDEAVSVQAIRELEEMGAEVMLSTKVEAFDCESGRLSSVRTSRGPVRADLMIMGVGVRPNTQLAGDAGLALGLRGAIKVNQRMQTSDPDIYAAGDCAEQTHLISGQPVWVPLGSTANKQARVAATNMTGGYDTFPGVLGTALVRIGKLNIGRTGLQLRDLEQIGLQHYASCVVPMNDKPGYMPGSAPLVLILHAERSSRKVVGAQAFGQGEISKRIDILATAITAGMTVDQVANLDLGYAPPFAPAMDVVITAANVLRNKIDAKTESVLPCELRQTGLDGKVIVDCREPDEYAGGHLAGSRLMPLGALAERADELSPDDDVVVYCKGGLRSAEGYRKLKQAGLHNVCYLEGGITAWCGVVEQ